MHENLEVALTLILSPSIDYAAIVVDELQPAKNSLTKLNISEKILYPMYELKECIENLYYDFLIFVSDPRVVDILPEQFTKFGLPKNKVVNIYLTPDSNNCFMIRRTMQYYEEHADEFEMFATGSSYISFCLDTTQFERKLFNFGRMSQDLYYDYQTAKFALSKNEKNKIQYALIGLSPISFHYDQSKYYKEIWRLLHYYLAFQDLHNFWLNKSDFENLFRKEFLNNRLSLDKFDLNNVYYEKPDICPPDFLARINARERIDLWKNRRFPETRNENVKILDDYLNLCDKNNVRSIMFLPPVTEGYAKYFDKQLLDEFIYFVHAAIKKHSSAVFINGWNMNNNFQDNDFIDVDHMNPRGAAKFSAILNKAIKGF